MLTARFNQIVLVLPCLFSIGLAIHCFECNSAKDPECADLTKDDTNTTLFRNCTGDIGNQNYFCRKVFTKNLNTDEERIVRTCGWIQNDGRVKEDNCRKVDNGFMQRINCACFTDACNGVGTFRPSWLNIAMTFVSLILIVCTK